MAEITAGQVKALREETGLPMMECKSALAEAHGDSEEAKNILQKKFKGKMESRASKETGEGRIAFHISDDRKSGAIIEIRCETAPVAKTDDFISLSQSIALAVTKQNAAEPSAEAVTALPSPKRPGKTIGDEITEVFGRIRENLKLQSCRRMTGGYLCAYVHHDGKSGVLIALDAAPKPESVGVDLCHHAVFANPMAINSDNIPAAEIERVRKISREMAEAEGKPAQILDKIVAGKVSAFCAENALMEQEHVKVSKTKVKDVLKQAGVNAVTDLCILRIG